MGRGFYLGSCWPRNQEIFASLNTLEMLVVHRADSASYRDNVEVNHGLESEAPHWIGSRMQALCNTFDYKTSELHGTGTFAHRSLMKGEKIIDLCSDDPSMAVPASDGSVAYFGQVLKAIGAARSLMFPMNDAGTIPNYDLLETVELPDALAHLEESRVQSAARATIIIETPPDEQGLVVDYMQDKSTGKESFDFLNLRMTVTQDVAAGEVSSPSPNPPPSPLLFFLSLKFS